MNWHESEARLNRYLYRPTTADAAFMVHGWGLTPTHYSNTLHKHSFFEICYVLDGYGAYIDDERHYELCRGTLFCSRPGITHQILSDTGMELAFVGFELDEHASSDGQRQAFSHLMRTDKICVYGGDHLPVALLWKSLFLLDGHEGALPVSALPAAGAALLLSFPALFSESSAYDRVELRRNPAQIINQAKRYISDNLGDNELSLQKIASYLNLSERHLSRLFSSGIHESFTDYVRRVRVRAATELLINTDLSIAAIAEQTGFGSVHYFSRTFRALMAEPPAQFRKNAVRGTTFI